VKKRFGTLALLGCFLLSECAVVDVAVLPKSERDIKEAYTHTDCNARVAGLTNAYNDGHGNEWGGFAAKSIGLQYYEGDVCPRNLDLARLWLQRALDEPNATYKDETATILSCVNAADYSPNCKKTGPTAAAIAASASPKTTLDHASSSVPGAGPTSVITTGGDTMTHGYVFCGGTVQANFTMTINKVTGERNVTVQRGVENADVFYTAVFPVPWTGPEFDTARTAAYNQNLAKWLYKQYPLVSGFSCGCLWYETRQRAESIRQTFIDNAHQVHHAHDPVRFIDYIPNPS
jgi:hypothetical protein